MNSILTTRAQRRAFRSNTRRASKKATHTTPARGKHHVANVAFVSKFGTDYHTWTAAMLLRHGLPSYTRNTAIAHEAGHAIAALSLGAVATAAEIFEDRAGVWLGWNDVTWPEENRPGRVINALEEPALASHALIYGLAGLAGEQLAGLDHQASSLDEVYEALAICVSVTHARRLDSCALMDRLLTSARERISQNGALFDAVCTHLDGAGSIDPEAVARLKAKHGLEVTPCAALW